MSVRDREPLFSCLYNGLAGTRGVADGYGRRPDPLNPPMRGRKHFSPSLRLCGKVSSCHSERKRRISWQYVSLEWKRCLFRKTPARDSSGTALRMTDRKGFCKNLAFPRGEGSRSIKRSRESDVVYSIQRFTRVESAHRRRTHTWVRPYKVYKRCDCRNLFLSHSRRSRPRRSPSFSCER